MRRPENWTVTKRKDATLAGKEHISKSGKHIKAKTLKPGCASCRKKCTELINEEFRKQIFNEYWNKENSWDMKRQFILSQVKAEKTKRHRPKDNSRNSKKITVRYYFNIKPNNISERIEVCKKFFVGTLGISETVVRNALKKEVHGGFLTKDMRGRHTPPNKLPVDLLNTVRAHITSFPVYDNHYTRAKSSKKYLGPELNRQKMYQLYLAKCEEDKIPKQGIAKFWLYKKIFNSEFNLGFKKPSNDTCDACDKFTLQLKSTANEEEKLAIQLKYDEHLREAELRYTEKRNNKEKSQLSTETTKVLMMDLQKCLPTPYLTNNQSFYFLKLWTLNLTIYDATEKKSFCMVWDESEAGRGGNEIASALLKWAEQSIANSSIEHLIIWSDNCPSQNRNIMICMSYFWLLKVCPNLKVVEHKFLLRGHTHMEADHVHALIERTLKKQSTMEICTPWDWQQLIRSTGATVIKMNLLDFKKLEVLYNQPGSPFISKKKNVDKEDFLISKVVHFQVKADSPGNLFYKHSFDENNEFKVLNVVRSARSQTKLPVELPAIRNQPKGITAKKHDFLIKSLKWVPSQFHDFFKQIPIAKKSVVEADTSDSSE